MSKESPTLQDLLKRDADKIKKAQNARRSKELEPEWILLAEFGLFFGWQAVVDVREDKISFPEMNKLLAAARRIESTNRYNRVMDMYAATMAQHKGGDKPLKQILKDIKDSWQTQT